MQCQSLSSRFSFDKLHLHHGVAIGQAALPRELGRLATLFAGQLPLLDENVEQRLSAELILGCLEDAAQALVVVTFPLGIGQAQHGLGDLVQQLLRLHRVLPGGVLTHAAVQLLVVIPDLGRVVLEPLEPEQLIVVRWTRPIRNAQPFLVEIHSRALEEGYWLRVEGPRTVRAG